MNNIKLKWYMLGGIFPLCLLLFLTKVTGVEAATSTTFPVDKAGIAAYAKLDSVDISDLTEALNFYHSIEAQEETYVIGIMEIENRATDGHTRGPKWVNYPHLYIGLDGWMVAYYLNTEETSQIMQWNGYAAPTINTTTLKDAIDIMCANIGVTYSLPKEIKYYDFEFPEANKLTLVAETAKGEYTASNSFSVTIPGTLYEASYYVYTGARCYGCDDGCSLPLDLSVDGVNVFHSPPGNWRSYYGYYDVSTQLEVGVPHYISFSRTCWAGWTTAGAATVLIYKVE